MEKPDQKSFRQLTISVEKLPASMGHSESLGYATQRARLLLGCYRTGDANDPDTYVAAIAAVLSRYSEDVITTVTHPATGLPSLKTWLPSVKEVRDACEEEADRIFKRVQDEQLIRRQFEDRRVFEEIRKDAPTMEELKKKYGPDWGLTSLSEPERPKFKAPSADDLRAHYSEFGIGFTRNEDAA